MDALAVVIFALAALGGAYLAYRHIQGQSLPGPVALIHGAAAAVALVILAVAVFGDEVGDAGTVALVIFVVAALGGFYLASFHLRDERRPTGLVLGHGVLAVVAFLTLVVGIM